MSKQKTMKLGWASTVGIATTLALGSTCQSSPDNIPVRAHGKSLLVPIYTSEEVPRNYCSRFVRKAGNKLFSVIIPAEDAWNLRYAGMSELLLTNVVVQGIPGDVITFYNPRSLFNNGTDKKGKTREYTHVGLYLGTNDSGRPLIADKYGKTTRVSTIEELTAQGLESKTLLLARKFK